MQISLSSHRLLNRKPDYQPSFLQGQDLTLLSELNRNSCCKALFEAVLTGKDVVVCLICKRAHDARQTDYITLW